MPAEPTVRWWKANEPKLVKHTDWEKDVLPALQSYESSKKSIAEADAGTDLAFFYKKVADWGAALRHAIQAKHDGLNKLVHGESRRKLEELLGALDRELKEHQAQAGALAGIKAGQVKAVGASPNAGRPLPPRPPGRNAF